MEFIAATAAAKSAALVRVIGGVFSVG